MSNCVNIHGACRLPLNNAWFRVDDFQKMIDNCPEKYEDIDKNDFNTQFIWWFFKFNTEFKYHNAYVNIGKGRSSHTWRDLKGLFKTIGEYLRNPEEDRRVTLKLSDEYDGFKKKFYTEFRLGNNFEAFN